MAESSNADNVPEGTTFIFGSWACTADGSDGFTGCLIAPKELKTYTDDQLPDLSAELDKKPSTQASPASNAKSAGYVPTPTRIGESAEPDVSPDSENFQFSETLRKYAAYLKLIKCPRVNNSELLDGVD
jgi:hypothetical protein